MMKAVYHMLGYFFNGLLMLFSPTKEKHSPQRQETLNNKTKNLILYHFEGCPYCARVRLFIRRNNLQVETRDIQFNKDSYNELMSGGGKTQVPCLAIGTENSDAKTWLYESNDIIAYLEDLKSAA